MRILTALVCLLLFTAPAASPAEDFTGKWSGKFTVVSGPQSPEDTAIYMDLTHKGKDLTGSAGPTAERQWPITKGVVDGNKLTFEVQSDGPRVHFTLAFANGRLIGDARAEHEGQTLTAKVDAGRMQ